MAGTETHCYNASKSPERSSSPRMGSARIRARFESSFGMRRMILIASDKCLLHLLGRGLFAILDQIVGWSRHEMEDRKSTWQGDTAHGPNCSAASHNESQAHHHFLTPSPLILSLISYTFTPLSRTCVGCDLSIRDRATACKIY
jgi:hypothetical protein